MHQPITEMPPDGHPANPRLRTALMPREEIVRLMAGDMAEISKNSFDGTVTFRNLLAKGWRYSDVRRYGTEASAQLELVLSERHGQPIIEVTTPADMPPGIRMVAENIATRSSDFSSKGKSLEATLSASDCTLGRIEALIGVIGREAREIATLSGVMAKNIASLKAREPLRGFRHG